MEHIYEFKVDCNFHGTVQVVAEDVNEAEELIDNALCRSLWNFNDNGYGELHPYWKYTYEREVESRAETE